MNFLIRLAQGATVLLIYCCIIHNIKKYDSRHGLPPKLVWKDMVMSFVSGICIADGSWIHRILLVICMGYLAAMAYTDYYSRKVYSLFYVLAVIPGAIWLVCIGKLENLVAIPLFLLFILFASYVVGAFRDGDVEVFIALTPYVVLLAYRLGIKLFMMFLIFLLTSMLTAVCGSLLVSIKRRKFVRENAMVPFIYGTMLGVVVLDNFI